MITIGNPRIEHRGHKVRLVSDLTLDGGERPLWIEVDERYGRFLCSERSDAFVLAILHWCVINGHDIRCQAPMTRRLYEQIFLQFMPAFGKMNNFSRCPKPRQGFAVAIDAPLADEVEHGNKVGSGCSCGVDSMHVYAAHEDVDVACLWNVHGITPNETDEKRAAGWNNLVRQAKAFSSRAGKELLIADTNFDRGCLPGLQWDGMTSYGNMFFVFALQKLWSKYYIASGCDARDVKLKISVHNDPAYYEFVLCPYLCLEGFRIEIDGIAHSRVDKVRDLARYPLSYEFLNVCHEIRADGRNCSFRCAKCMYTMMDLDAAGVLDKYEKVFDVNWYYTHQEEVLAEYWRGLLQGNSYIEEIRPYFSGRHWSWRSKLGAAVILGRKSIKKALRLGRVSSGTFSSRG